MNKKNTRIESEEETETKGFYYNGCYYEYVEQTEEEKAAKLKVFGLNLDD